MSGMHGGGAAWRLLRSDRSVVHNRIERGTVRRVLGFAQPHRRLIAVFLALTVVDAGMVVVTPLLAKHIVDDGIKGGDQGLITMLALAMAATAIVSAILAVGEGWLSSRIGEGLIYDLRTQVFGHVQRQSLAFLPAPRPGRWSPAQQRRHRCPARIHLDALHHGGEHGLGGRRRITMVALSWQVTLLCLAIFPLLVLVSRWVSARLAGLTADQMDGNADMGNAMTERFNVGGAMLLKRLRTSQRRGRLFASKAARVRDLGVRISLLTRLFGATMMAVPALATALVYGVGGHWPSTRRSPSAR